MSRSKPPLHQRPRHWWAWVHFHWTERRERLEQTTGCFLHGHQIITEYERDGTANHYCQRCFRDAERLTPPAHGVDGSCHDLYYGSQCSTGRKEDPVKKTYYTAGSLEADLGEFEDRYELTSPEFFAAYSQDGEELARISSHDRIVWASLYGALCRVRGTR